VRRADAGVVAALAGLTALIIGLSDVLTRYLRPTMARWLVVGGAVTLILGVASLLLQRSGGDHASSRDPGHEHGVWTTRVGWMLLLPVLVAVVIDPGSLGSYAVNQQAVTRSPLAEDFDLASLLEARSFSGQTVQLTHLELWRGVEAGESLEMLAEVPLTLEGIVVHDDGLRDGFVLGRFLIGCCAGDALPISVIVSGDPATDLPDDTWVRAEVTFDQQATATARTEGGDWAVVAAVVGLTSLQVIDEPSEPYLYP
jgi:uncharacterized repeat protein (TIGR03943 family)